MGNKLSRLFENASLMIDEWKLRRAQTKSTKEIVDAAVQHTMRKMNGSAPKSLCSDASTRTVTLQIGFLGNKDDPALRIQYVPNDQTGGEPSYNVWTENEEDSGATYNSQNLTADKIQGYVKGFIVNELELTKADNEFIKDTSMQLLKKTKERFNAVFTMDRALYVAAGVLGASLFVRDTDYNTQPKNPEPVEEIKPVEQEPKQGKPLPPGTQAYQIAGTDYVAEFPEPEV